MRAAPNSWTPTERWCNFGAGGNEHPFSSRLDIVPDGGRSTLKTEDRFPDDWSAHELRPVTDPASGVIYMADAAARAASILVFPWDDIDRLTPASWKTAPALAPPDVAFDEAGLPIRALHELQGGIVWSYNQFGTFQTPVPYLPDMTIEYEDWDEAWFMTTYVNSSRDACREVAAIVADVLTTIAVKGLLKTHVRPAGGAAAMVDPPERAWLIDDPVARLARCGLVFDRPGDTTSPPDHLIFFDGAGFDDVVRTFLPTHWHPLHGEISDLPPPGRLSITQRRTQLIKTMIVAIDQDRNKRWTRRALLAAIEEAGLSDFTRNMFEVARDIALSRTQIEVPNGRPRSPQQPQGGSNAEETSGKTSGFSDLQPQSPNFSIAE